MGLREFNGLKKQLAENCEVEILAEGNSMLPLINPGQRLSVKLASLQFGDIAVFFLMKKMELFCAIGLWEKSKARLFSKAITVFPLTIQ